MITRIAILQRNMDLQQIFSHAIRLSRIELLQRYKRSFLGIWWSLLNPLITVTVYYLIFNEIIRIEDFSKKQYFIYLVSGVIIVNFCIQTVTAIAENFSVRVGVITRLKVNPYTLAQGTLGASVFNFFMTLLPFFILLLFDRGISPRVLLLFPLICVMMYFFFGIGLLFAIVYTLFDDAKAITRIVFSFMPFFTPVFYKLDQLPQDLQYWVAASPFTNFLVLFRWSIGESENLQISTILNLALSLVFSSICLTYFRNKWDGIVKLL